MAESVFSHLNLFFSFIKEENGNVQMKCLLCKPKDTIISTSVYSAANLRRHIMRRHQTSLTPYDECVQNKKSEKRKRSEMETRDSNKRSTQTSMTMFGDGRTPFINQSKVDQLVFNCIILELMPFSTVEKEHFKNLVTGLQPSRNVMCRTTLMRRLDTAFIEMTGALRKVLECVDAVATTADCWTACKRSYLGVTVHWINETSLERCSASLACKRIRGSHTFDVLAKELEDIHLSYKIAGKVIETVTDNGSNFCKAFRVFGATEEESSTLTEDTLGDFEENVSFIELTEILNDEDSDFHLPRHRRCACHTLNLVACKDSIKAEENSLYKKVSRGAFAKCQALWNRQNQSAQAAEKVKEICGNYLVVPNATRWNSTYSAMKCLKKINKSGSTKIEELCLALKVERLRPGELAFLLEYVEVMQPLSSALDILQSEKKMFLGILLPTLKIVRQQMENLIKANNLRSCCPLAEAILNGVDFRFESLYNDRQLTLASVFHPKFKLTWLAEEKKTAVIKMMEVEVDNMQRQLSASSQEGNNQALQDNSNIDDDEDDDDDNFFKSLTMEKQGQESPGLLELHNYLAQKCGSIQTPLQGMPVLQKLFIKWNTGIPSSAPVERLFSAGGRVFVPRRSRISDENFEKQLLLKVNHGKF